MSWLDHGDLLAGLDATTKRELRSLGAQRRFRAGDMLFPNVLFPPAPADSHAVLITEGLVKLTAISPDGHETLLSVHGHGALLGEEGALRHRRGDRHRRVGEQDRRVVVTALKFVTARAFPPQAMNKFLLAHPDILAEMALGLCERLEDAESRIASAARDSANRRLARLLCDLERHGYALSATRGGTALPITLSQADLASWIGTCSETVGRALRAWRDRGFVSIEPHCAIVVHDLEALARIAGIQISRRSWNWPTMRPAS